MFLVRAVAVVVCLIMLLPTDPALHRDQIAAEGSGRFCDRYPKTCDASGELLSAFKHKLVYGIKLIRQSLDTRSEPYGGTYHPSKFDGRLEPWRAPGRAPATYGDGTLRPDERSRAWYRDH